MSKIAVLLAPGFADWEYALIAGTGGPFYGFDVQFFGVEARTVVSQGGLMASTSQSLDDLRPWQPDVVVVVGSMIWEGKDAPDIRTLLTELYDQGVAVAGICGGTLALARSGLLNAVRHTSNNKAFIVDNAQGYQGAERYVESASAISDARLITAPGTAPASFAAAVFAAVGLPDAAVSHFRSMMAAEHRP